MEIDWVSFSRLLQKSLVLFQIASIIKINNVNIANNVSIANNVYSVNDILRYQKYCKSILKVL